MWGKAQGRNGGMEALKMTGKPGKPPSAGANRLDEPDWDRRLYAGHGVKYYIVSDLSRERPHAEPLSRTRLGHPGDYWRL